jgi:hypothetical protein
MKNKIVLYCFYGWTAIMGFLYLYLSKEHQHIIREEMKRWIGEISQDSKQKKLQENLIEMYDWMCLNGKNL